MFAARQTAALVILPESTSPDPCTSSLCLLSLRAIFPHQDPHSGSARSRPGWNAVISGPRGFRR